MSSSGVDTKAKSYKLYMYQNRATRDAMRSSQVKRAGELYLPMPNGFRNLEFTAPTSVIIGQNLGFSEVVDLTESPFYHSNPAYTAYLQRARFPELVFNTLTGLIGVATRKDMTVEIPKSLQYMVDDCTRDGKTIYELFVTILTEVLITGRCTLVLDINPDTNNFVIATYASEATINWRGEGDSTEFVVFEEAAEEPKKDNMFQTEEVLRHRVFRIGKEGEEFRYVDPPTGIVTVEDAAGVVVCDEYVDGEIVKSTIPMLQGEYFYKIPAISVGSLENTHEPNPSPLYGIAEIAYAIYRRDADLANAQYQTCNPTLVLSGCDGKVPVLFGSSVALVLESPEAKAYFPNTDTSALDHVKETINELREEAAQFGASLLGPTKRAVESTETVKTRQSAQSTTLVGIVNNIAEAMTKIFEMAAEIDGSTPETVSIIIPTDFAELSLSPQMLTALVSAWQNGVLSKLTLIELMIDAGLINHAEEAEDELTRIFAEGPENPVRTIQPDPTQQPPQPESDSQ